MYTENYGRLQMFIGAAPPHRRIYIGYYNSEADGMPQLSNNE